MNDLSYIPVRESSISYTSEDSKLRVRIFEMIQSHVSIVSDERLIRFSEYHPSQLEGD